MNDIADSTFRDAAAFGPFDRFLRQQLIGQMGALRHGRLRLQDACGTVELGERSSSQDDLQIRVQVCDPAFYRALASACCSREIVVVVTWQP